MEKKPVKFSESSNEYLFQGDFCFYLAWETADIFFLNGKKKNQNKQKAYF